MQGITHNAIMIGKAAVRAFTTSNTVTIIMLGNSAEMQMHE